MLSRVAESVYWMSRYVERAENVARFIDVNFQLMLDEAVGATGNGSRWSIPLATTKISTSDTDRQRRKTSSNF